VCVLQMKLCSMSSKLCGLIVLGSYIYNAKLVELMGTTSLVVCSKIP